MGCLSKLEPGLERNHPRTAVATESNSEQAGWRRSRVGERSEAGLRRGFAGNSCQGHARQSEVGMIEQIEELRVKAQFHLFGHGKPFGEIEVIPEKVWSAKLVPSAISKLAIRLSVVTVTGACARVHRRNNASGFSHWMVPGCVAPGMSQCRQ